ncbi:unnamed protein product [Paramecium sonneborni]|uniref:Transmembrane protein n=1 Tax=Paramecium sonneborni TaxID=65129 RepID=A0A8S1JZL7_9CILI|nr:unnamed protein product [Paramecium sonneborni]
MNYSQLYYLLSIDAVFIILLILSQFECIKQQFIKYQKGRKQRRSQTKPQLFSPGASFFHHHQTLDPEANSDEQKQGRRKSRATTLKLSQSANNQNELNKNTNIRKSIKNHTTLTIVSQNSYLQTTPESNKHRNTIRKHSQFVTNLITPETARKNFNTNQSDHGSKLNVQKQANQQFDNKKMKPFLLYFPIIKGFIQLTHSLPTIFIQCWARLIFQLIYVDLMTFYEFVFIPVFFIANRLIDKIIRRIVRNYSDRIIYGMTATYMVLAIGTQVVYMIFANFNYLSIVINLIDIFGIDILIYCIFRLYRVTENKQEQDLDQDQI